MSRIFRIGGTIDWREVRIPSGAVRALVVFFALLLVSATRAESPLRSLLEVSTYGANAVLMTLIVWHVRTRERLLRCLDMWEIAVAVAVAGGLLGMLGTSGPLAAYLLPSLPILWYQLVHRSRTRRTRWLRAGLIAAALAVLPATGSRSGLLLGVAMLALLFAGRGIVGFLGRRPTLKLATLALALGIGAEALRTEARDWPLPFHRAVSVSHAEEVSVPGDSRTGLPSYAPDAGRSPELPGTYLGVWAEAGVLALSALLVFCASVLRAGWRTTMRGADPATVALGLALTVSALAILAWGVTHSGLRMCCLWAIFGLILAAGNVVGIEAGAPAAARRRSA